jgi:hypothetical protein
MADKITLVANEYIEIKVRDVSLRHLKISVLGLSLFGSSSQNTLFL